MREACGFAPSSGLNSTQSISARSPEAGQHWPFTRCRPSDREAVSLGHLETALDFEVRKVSEGSDDFKRPFAYSVIDLSN